MKVQCFNGHERKGKELRCIICNQPFEIIPDQKYTGNIEDNFPYVNKWLSLGEVETPIVQCSDDLFFKLDYFSPTYSYKDRGTRVLMSYLKSQKETHIKNINEDSSGNAGASIAAYSRKAGFDANIFVPENANASKLKQIEAYGANIIKIKGSRDDVQIAAENAPGIYASHILNPEFRDGIRTLAYEIFKQFQNMPDNIFIPVSAGTLLSGLFSGLKHLKESGEIKKIPELVAVQPNIISPLCSVANGTYYNPDNDKTSIADALVAKKPVLLKKMSEIIKDGNSCITVSEKEIIEARKDLALKGIYAEYSSATVFAAYRKKTFNGSSLLVLTGNGLKN
ncbi:MAG: pyridoxal-phosphate dependent enzyme [Ferroplasma sp.]